MTSAPADYRGDGPGESLWHVNALLCWAKEQDVLDPRGPSRLVDLVAGIGLDPRASILEIGCGQGHDACELANRFGGQVVALDPLERNRNCTRALAKRKNLEYRVQIEEGWFDRLPFADDAFDLIWCRNAVFYVSASVPVLRECARVLAPTGLMMLQNVFATDLLEPQEALLLRQRLRLPDDSMSRAKVETSLLQSGFRVLRTEVFGSEFAEWREAQEGRCAHDLDGIARLQRAENVIVETFGREPYETVLGMYYWHVFQMLGKISYHAHLVTKAR